MRDVCNQKFKNLLYLCLFLFHIHNFKVKLSKYVCLDKNIRKWIDQMYYSILQGFSGHDAMKILE